MIGSWILWNLSLNSSDHLIQIIFSDSIIVITSKYSVIRIPRSSLNSLSWSSILFWNRNIIFMIWTMLLLITIRNWATIWLVILEIHHSKWHLNLDSINIMDIQLINLIIYRLDNYSHKYWIVLMLKYGNTLHHNILIIYLLPYILY